jgi:hypothetical protein
MVFHDWNTACHERLVVPMTVDPIPFRADNKLIGGKSLEIGGPMDIRILNSIFAESLENTASIER